MWEIGLAIILLVQGCLFEVMGEPKKKYTAEFNAVRRFFYVALALVCWFAAGYVMI